MLTLRFRAEDVARVRFAYSPLHELFQSLRSAPHTGSALVQVTEGRGRGVAVLRALLTTRRQPAFITPPPLPQRHPTFHAELRALHQISPAVLRTDLVRAYGHHPPRELRELHSSPDVVLPELLTALDRGWEMFSSSAWPGIRARLEDAIATRSQELGQLGLGSQIMRIAPGVEWDDGALNIPKSLMTGAVELNGRGLALVPTTADLSEPAVILDAPWQPTVFFAIGTSAARPRQADGDLSALLGPTRAAILAAIATPATTSGLAAALSEDPGNVSRHLHVLRRAGLATARRYGRRVWYGQTDTARSLIAAES